MSLIIAHRGYSAKFRENSVSSWREAVLAGADIIEVDVRFTADWQCVCAHDADLRLAGSQSLIRNCRYAELQAQAQSLVPLLSQAFKTIPPEVPILLDVKDESPQALAHLSSLVSSFGERPVDFGLHTLRAVHTLMREETHVRIVGLLSGSEDEEDEFFEMGGKTLRLWESKVGTSRLEKLLTAGRAIWVTTGGWGTGRDVGEFDAQQLVAMRDAGVTGFLVNDPVLARSALEDGTSH